MRTRRDCLRALSASALAMTPARALADGARPFFEEQPVFVAGTEYPFYRIPAVLGTRRGTLLALAEGRQTLGDHSQNDLVLRRSTDGARTWEPLQVVAQDRPNVFSNPTLVESQRAKRVCLMFQRYAAGFDERKAVPGYEDPRVCRTFVAFSTDEGKTWTSPREVTRQVKRPEGVTSTATGPGVGIELQKGRHRGRLVMPFNEGPYGAWRVYAAYSDDGGETWRYGDAAPDPSKGIGNEAQVVELSDGRLMMNARSMGGRRRRLAAYSSDGGETWSALADVEALSEPECQASIIRHAWPGAFSRGRLLFANPATEKGRVNGTVRMSTDEGRTWPVSRIVCEGPFAYSCLAAPNDGSIGLLYERDQYRTIAFARFNLEWLRSRG